MLWPGHSELVESSLSSYLTEAWILILTVRLLLWPYVLGLRAHYPSLSAVMTRNIMNCQEI
jgi:hypothetical protein